MRNISMNLMAVLFLYSVPSLFTSAWGQDATCNGLKGAAFGQCTAALAVGCDGKETQAPGCKKIEENFARVTGESAPWVTGFCSCYTYDEVYQYLADGPLYGYATSYRLSTVLSLSGEPIGKRIEIPDDLDPHPVFGAELYSPEYTAKTKVFGACANFKIRYKSLFTADEASACWANIAVAVDRLNIQKKE